MPNFNLLLTVTSDIINGVLFALFNPVFVPYIRFTEGKITGSNFLIG
jgi:hypothetical protein